jgi:2-oxo-3-hexenedioate decarboxylase
MADIGKWVEVLAEAERRREPIGPITEGDPTLDLDAAYDVQRARIAQRLAQGERIVGAKLGLTSKAKQVAMGIDTPIFGVLTDAMQLDAATPLPLGELIHPRAEPEIAFVLGEDLSGPGVTAHDVIDAASGVCAAIEVIDSRYVDFRFTLADVVADNTSAARFVLGTTLVDPRSVDLTLLGVVVETDGVVSDTAAGAAVLGHPATAVALLANQMGAWGEHLPRGATVLSGGLTNAVAVASGHHLTMSFAHLGQIFLRSG